MTIIWNSAPQGTPEWKAARRGAITGSRAKDARARTDGMTDQQRTYASLICSGVDAETARMRAGYVKAPKAEKIDQYIAGTLVLEWTDTALSYAYDLAREREGGTVPETFQGAAMRTGKVEEPVARLTYEAERGVFVDEVGFAHTADGKFGASPDGLVGGIGGVEIKTMVSSNTLFRVMVDGDIDEYRDQCLFEMWLLSLDWIDLCLWAPDLHALQVIRFERDDNEIDDLEQDMLAFDQLVEQLRAKLRAKLRPAAVESDSTPIPAAEVAAAPAPAPKPTLVVAPDAVPELF